MKNGLRRFIVTMIWVGTMIGSTSALSYAAGFWNYTPYTLHIHFTNESCPWVLRWVCGNSYAIPPFKNGIPGSVSSNNAAGTVEIGGGDSNILIEEDGTVWYSWEVRVIEVGPQDYINFALEGTTLRMRIHRADTKIDEIESLPLRK